MMGPLRALVPAVAGGLLLVAVAPGNAPAQRAWRPKARISAEVRYDDNPFLLTGIQKTALAAVSAADSQSGRFVDMPHAIDVIAVPAFRVGLTGPAIGGHDLTADADLRYEANVQNTRRRHAELGASVEQALGGGARIRLAADLRPGYFWKNYLRDAVDADLSGNITPDERLYSAGTSNEGDFALRYRQRVVKSKQTHPLGLTGEITVNYFTRSYDAPFADRSRHGPGGSAALAADLGPSWTVELGYSYASLKADVTRVVLILNETAFGVDFNSNGNQSDTEARAFELVDRSRREQELGLTVRGELSDAVTAEAVYGRRTRTFSSMQPYDVADRDRRDTRDAVDLGLTFRLAHGLRLLVAGELASQRTNRAGDPGSLGEVADYHRRVVSAGMRWAF